MTQSSSNRPQVHHNYILTLMSNNDEISVRAAIKTALAEYLSDEQLNRLLDRYIKQIVSE